MNLAVTVVNITAPVFLLAGIGVVWVRLGFEYRVAFVTRLAMSVAVPCLIFVALMETEVEAGALADLTLASLAAYGAVTLAMTALTIALRLDRRTYLSPLIFGNTGNLGLPLAFFAFGDVGLDYAVVVFAVMAILSFTLGIWMVAGRGSLGRVVQEPVVGATLLGALFLWQGWHLPVFLTNTLDLVGQMAIPLMLMTLGVAIARLEAKQMGLAVALSVAKLVICAALAWWIAVQFGLEPVSASVLIVQVATPVAVTSYLIAEKYGVDAGPVAGLVVASTLLSVVALPLLLSVLL